MSRPHPRPTGAAASIAVLLWLSSLAAPLAVVQACSCSWLGTQEEVAVHAIAVADVAFIGTVTAASPVFGFDFMGFGGPNVRYSFDVELASVATSATTNVDAVNDGGGACGFTFDIGDRWLIAASDADGTLRTSLCAGNTPLPPERAGMAQRLLTHLPFAPLAETDDGPLDALLGYLPVAAGAALVLSALVGTMLAFRRRTR